MVLRNYKFIIFNKTNFIYINNVKNKTFFKIKYYFNIFLNKKYFKNNYYR